MKFLFLIEDCIRRKHPHTYENYINKGGFSGTDTQIIEMTNHLNIMGHEAHIIKDSELMIISNIKFAPKDYATYLKIKNFKFTS